MMPLYLICQSMKKIAIYEAEAQEKRSMRKLLNGYELVFSPDPLSIDTDFIDGDVEALSTFINSKVTKEVIDKFPALKLIATRSTGYDHIDLQHAHDTGIEIANVPHYGENTVAEHTFALILALSRLTHKSYIRTQQDNYIGSDLVGFDLEGKTIGIIGTGNIGLHVIKIARGFGMNVLAFSRTQDPFIAELLSFSYTTKLDELLSQSDIISLHIPLNEDTKHFLNKENFKQCKKGAIIINTSRGGVIDTDALYQYLSSGHLGGAGLDVIEGEEYIQEDYGLIAQESNAEVLKRIVQDKEIFKMDNVVFTPHIAYNSREARERIIQITAENICRFFSQKDFNRVESKQ